MTDTPTPSSRRISPGCLVFLVGIVWLLVLGGWMIWSMYAQLREIRTFTDTSAKPVAFATPDATAIKALDARINDFGAAVGRKEKAELRLTVEDLNTLLATADAAKGMKENAKIESIGETIHVQISVMMNGVPFSGEHLFLNGFADLIPEMDKDKGVQLKTRSVAIPGKTVTDGFIQHYKENNHLDTLLLDELRNSKDTAIMDVLKKLTTIRLEPGTAVLEFAP